MIYKNLVYTDPNMVVISQNILSMFMEAWNMIGANKKAGVALGTVFTEMNNRVSNDWNWREYYHVWPHIVNIVAIRNTIIPHIGLTPEAVIAIYYHDIVYDPKRNDNEERSAEFAASEMDGASQYSIDRVKTIILGTKTHTNPIDKDMGRVLDLDLASLGFSYETFLENGCKIKNEYNHISDDLFNQGRKEFLAKMLERKFIYSTRQFRKVFERKARNNIKRFLENGPRQ